MIPLHVRFQRRRPERSVPADEPRRLWQERRSDLSSRSTTAPPTWSGRVEDVESCGKNGAVTRARVDHHDRPVQYQTSPAIRATAGRARCRQQRLTCTCRTSATWRPVHNGNCNVLFADGSIRSFKDKNGDGYLNPGFTVDSTATQPCVRSPRSATRTPWSNCRPSRSSAACSCGSTPAKETRLTIRSRSIRQPCQRPDRTRLLADQSGRKEVSVIRCRLTTREAREHESGTRNALADV